MLLHKLRAALAAVVVAAALGVTAPASPPASAEPITSQAIGPAPNYKHRATVSSTRYSALKLAKKLKKHTKGKTLDYRNARKVFGKHSSWRRQFAAGWKLAGGKISHISGTELKKIAKERKKRQPKVVALSSGSVVAMGGGTNCRGVTKYVRYPLTDDYPNRYYYDSCDTNKITRNLGWCMGAAGIVALLMPNPGVGTMMGLLIAVRRRLWMGHHRAEQQRQKCGHRHDRTLHQVQSRGARPKYGRALPSPLEGGAAVSTYRQRVHRSAKIVGIMLAVTLIVWATLVGLGYAFVTIMNLTAILMIVALATTVLTRTKRAGRR